VAADEIHNDLKYLKLSHMNVFLLMNTMILSFLSLLSLSETYNVIVSLRYSLETFIQNFYFITVH